MKNKKSIYVLLPLALLIWGGVVYQFFSFSSDEIPEVTAEAIVFTKPPKVQIRDTISINANYRDPFLGKVYDATNKKRAIQKVRKKPLSPVAPIAWPEVSYKGIVSDQNGKSQVFMLQINRKTFLLKRGQTQDGIFLNKGDRTSVELVFEKQKQIFAIK